MSVNVNVLGLRKRAKIMQATGLPVLRAWVISHDHSGRFAYLTIGWTRTHQAHRHAWFDRHTGTLKYVPDGAHNTSCYDLFPGEMTAREARAALVRLIMTLDGPW